MTQRIGVTGSRGFVARWLIERLRRDKSREVVELPRSGWDSPEALRRFVEGCDTIVHLAGVNRGEPDEVETTNVRLAEQLTEACRQSAATPHIVYASSTKRSEDSPYGRGKLGAEEVVRQWSADTGAGATVLVIPNVYGAGCRPYYNSVVATFCHQLTHGEQPQVLEDRVVDFVWVSDLVERIEQIAMAGAPSSDTLETLEGNARLAISELLATLERFRHDYFERQVTPDLTSPLMASLYSTFLSYLDLEDHVHRPPLHSDDRGDLCEVIKTAAGGQVFFSTTRPGVTRGNHYHTRKVEWFCVVRGRATIRLRAIDSEQVHEFRVSGAKPEFVSIPVLHTHSIENSGDEELLTLFWCNEVFDASDADTHYEDVLTPAAAQAA